MIHSLYVLPDGVLFTISCIQFEYIMYSTSGNVWLELILIVALLVYISQGERSTLGATSLGSLSQSGSLSPRRNSRGSLGGSRSSLHRSNESLPMASRSATADAIFMEEFGKGEKEAAAPREGKQQAGKSNSP